MDQRAGFAFSRNQSRGETLDHNRCAYSCCWLLRQWEIAVGLEWSARREVLSWEQMCVKPFRSLRHAVSQKNLVTLPDSPIARS